MYLKIGGKIQDTKRCSTITVRKCLPEAPNISGHLAIQITIFRISGDLLYVTWFDLCTFMPEGGHIGINMYCTLLSIIKLLSWTVMYRLLLMLSL
jgi:hypothetical protein